MANMDNKKIMAYAAFACVVLGLLLPFIKVPFLGGLGILTNLRALGEMSWMMYLIAVLGIGLAGYTGVLVFKCEKDYTTGAYMSAAYFLILVIIFMVVKSKVRSAMGDDFGFFASTLTASLKLGFGTFMFLIGAVLLYFADKQVDKPQIEE